jgi:hypothetical protein
MAQTPRDDLPGNVHAEHHRARRGGDGASRVVAFGIAFGIGSR